MIIFKKCDDDKNPNDIYDMNLEEPTFQNTTVEIESPILTLSESHIFDIESKSYILHFIS